MEWLDYAISAEAAALVFPKVFFPFSGALSFALAIASFGIVYVTRPLGSLVFGWVGDTVGRRRALILSLTAASLGFLLIGLLPPYGVLGLFSVILLFILRGIMGLGIGGSNGTVIAIEHLHGSSRRGLLASVVWATGTLGFVVGALVFIIALVLLPETYFIEYGWRIIFVAMSIFLLGATLWVVLEVGESPLFAPDRAGIISIISRIIGEYGIELLYLSLIQVLPIAFVSLIAFPYAIILAQEVGVSPVIALFAVAVGFGSASISGPVGGLLADRVGRKAVSYIGLLGGVLAVSLFFPLVVTGNAPLIFLGALLLGLTGGMAGAATALINLELFKSSLRYTGSAFTYNLAILEVGLLTTFVEPLIVDEVGVVDAYPYVAGITAVLGLIGASCLVRLRETRNRVLTS
jgi:MFS family permease